MVAAIRERGIKFQVWPDDHDPPHVHVYVDGEDIRINLETDEFIDKPPPGQHRAIKKAYRKHREDIRQLWRQYHR